jgi:hypothetical protein
LQIHTVSRILSKPFCYYGRMVASVYFGGSRSLLPSALLTKVVCVVVDSVQRVQVGCQFGADEQVIQAAAPSSRSVFAVALGYSSAPRHVQKAQLANALVLYATGDSSAPLHARYLRRSIAALRGCSQAMFFAPGQGSLAVARECLKAELPVFAFSLCAPAPISSSFGQWVPSGFKGFRCWQWLSPM